MMDCARKLAVHYQELHDVARRDPSVKLAIELETADRLQDSRPVEVVVRRTHVRRFREKDEVLHVENARCLVRTLKHSSNTKEVPSFVMTHRRIGDSLEHVTGHAYAAKDFRKGFMARQ